ncbi:magnesium/cobalt transporter CorA [Nemorincola caseinilytica]|uniref:Magnesium/cobalt transporter CorA n=1 Tax=Nemorincola caseinilytica TaxID=2054315 RepID=A0ABP8N8D4_9BACT
MTTELATDNCSFEWLDVTDPTKEELQGIAQQYGLHPASVSDCLQPGHLPKYEQFTGYTFIILRVYMTTAHDEADTVQALTGKIAIFVSERFIITIHRKPWEPIHTIQQTYVHTNRCTSPFHVLNVLVRTGLHTFDEPAVAIDEQLDLYEKKVFLTVRKEPLLKGLYFMKQKLEVMRRLLLHTYDIVDKMDREETANAYTRDVRDLYIKQKSLYDSMYENATHLLNLYFNISAQRTNETMRVLTIFSVFFMPLTFIAGIYGMNFRYMPELEWRHGYPVVLGAMAVVVIVIFFWFRRKRWM